MTTSATNELGKHPSKKVIMEFLETNNETNKLVVGLWKTSQNYEVTTCHSRETIYWIDMNKKTRTYFNGGDR